MFNDSYTLFETANVKLEQFLFAHEIHYARILKDPVDGLTYWQYQNSPRLERIIAEFSEVQEIRRQRLAAKRSGAAHSNHAPSDGNDAA
ncbi:MAG: hypothetical protein J6A79_02915 [Clostridia bacterium]|nr:hypothetical protein [Clostridia bacterium]